MNKETAIKLFESRQIRTAWNEDEEEWYFSVVDVVGALTSEKVLECAKNAAETGRRGVDYNL